MMKKRVLALGLVIACMSVVSAQPPQPPQQQPQAWAEKMFGPPANLDHDFGTVPRGAQLRHDFVMTNIYAVPIEITDLRPSMGPLSARTSKHLLQPNEKAIISVQMDARRFNGPRSVKIYVNVGPTYISTVRLTVTAFSLPDVVCSPGEVAFGSMAPGQTPSATVDVEYAGPLAWQVSEAVVPKEAPFEATVKELYRRPGQVAYQVTVSLKKNAAPGQFQENIFLKTNDPNGYLLQVLVRGNIQAPLEAVPATMDLKEVKSGETLTRSVFIRSHHPFKVVGIEGPDAVQLGEPPLPNLLQTVTLQIVPPPQEGPFHYEVKIYTDLQDAPPVVMMIDGVAAKK
jgi:hypothetical protein